MKTLVTVLCSVVFALSFSSCAMLKERNAKHEAATVAYLCGKKTAPAAMNIEGLWYSPEWGIVIIKQEPGGKLSGIFQGSDSYNIRGVVSGKAAYLTLLEDDWAEYTVELKRKSWSELTGYYSSSVPFSDSDKEPVLLKRISY